MKKNYVCFFALMLLFAASCQKTNSGDPVVTADAVVGAWHYVAEEDAQEWEFNANFTYSKDAFMRKEEGTYSVANGVISITRTREWSRDYVREEIHGGPIRDENGNYVYTEWKENPSPDKTPASYRLKMMYGEDVMLWLVDGEEKGEPVTLTIPFLRHGASSPSLSDINVIQGKWYWHSVGMIRAVIIVKGDQGEIIITPWGERYTGKVRYEKGVLYMDSPIFSTSRYEDPANPEVYDHINNQHPEDTPWRSVDGGGFYGESIRYSFVPDGQKAYSVLANLVAEFNKEN